MQITTRIDNITHISDEYLTDTPPAPKSVKIELTSRCNFNCTFCASGQRLRIKGDMDRVLFRRLARELREVGVEELGLFYLGESFLASELIRAIDFAKHFCKFPYVFLTTNGSLATENKVRQAILAGLDSLKFSLNYASPEQFAEITRTKPEIFYNILENLRGARRARDEIFERTGHRCGLYASYIQYTAEQADKMQPMIEEVSKHVDEVYALPLYNQAALVPNTRAVAGNLGRIGALREPVPCWSLFTEGHITYDGKLSACCFDHDGRFEMGDLTKEPFMDCWHSEKFRQLRQAHIAGDVTETVCEKCVAWH